VRRLLRYVRFSIYGFLVLLALVAIFVMFSGQTLSSQALTRLQYLVVVVAAVHFLGMAVQVALGISHRRRTGRPADPLPPTR